MSHLDAPPQVPSAAPTRSRPLVDGRAMQRVPPQPTQAAQRSRRLVRHRDFRLLWIGETTSRLGSAVTSVALPLVAVTTLHAGPFTLGLLTAAPWVPWLLIGLPAGVWVDRLPRRPIMIGCDAVAALLLASVPVAAWAGVLTVGQLLVVALFGGATAVFFTTAYGVYLPSLVGPAELVEGNAKMTASESAAQVVGPGLGGALAQVVGAAGAVVVDAASFVVSAVCLLAVRTPEAGPDLAARRESMLAEVRAGLRFVRRDPYLRITSVSAAASNLALTGMEAILVLFLVRAVGLGSGTVGGLLSVSSVGGVLGALLAPGLAARYGSARTLLFAGLGTAPFVLLIPLTAPGWRLALFACGSAIGVGGLVASNILLLSFRQAYCPPALLGRVIASMRVLVFGTMPLGGVLGGATAAALGLRPALWIMLGGVVLASFILPASPIRRLRDLPTAPAQATD